MAGTAASIRGTAVVAGSRDGAAKELLLDLNQKEGMTPSYSTRIGTRPMQTEPTFHREVNMKSKSLGVVIALSMALPLGFAGTALAAKKKPEHLTYEQAWAKCKLQVDKLQSDAQSQRYSRGAACMYMYGYRI